MKEQILKLRKETGASIIDCNKALKICTSYQAAKSFLISKIGDKNIDKMDRITNEGIIVSYIHQNSKIGSMVSLKCETDFVTKNDIFIKLANDIALHVAALNPININELINQPFIKNESISINDYIQQVIAKIGENIKIDNFVRFTI